MPTGNSNANPPPPIRTDSSLSAASTYLPTPRSAAASPATPYSTTSSKSPNTPAERSFFGALAHNIRERSRSRSRAGKQAQQTPASPPVSTPSSPVSTATSATLVAMSRRSSRHTRPHGMRMDSDASARTSSSTTAKRTSTTSSDISFEKFSYGRHSNDVSTSDIPCISESILMISQWLFNGFSVKDTASKLFGRNHDE